jgi:hypothetical protein
MRIASPQQDDPVFGIFKQFREDYNAALEAQGIPVKKKWPKKPTPTQLTNVEEVAARMEY